MLQLNETIEVLKELRETLRWSRDNGNLSKKTEGKIEEFIEKLLGLLERHMDS